jgi:hypothetical protein
VNRKWEWYRHLAKQQQDAAERIPEDVVLPPLQPEYLEFRVVVEEEYLVAPEPEFLEMPLLGKRGFEDMDDLEVLQLPKRRHTEPNVEVEAGVEANRSMEGSFLDDVPPRPPDDVSPSATAKAPPSVRL